MTTRREILAGAIGFGAAMQSGAASTHGALDSASERARSGGSYPRIGVYSSVSSTNMSDYGAEVMAFEKRGISRVCVDEDRDAMVSAAALICGSRNVEIATGWCAPGRAPMLLATAARWLNAFSSGRFTLGIGINAAAIAPVVGIAWSDRHEFLRDYLIATRRALDTPAAYDETVAPPMIIKLTDLAQFHMAGMTCDGVALGQMTPLAAYTAAGSELMRVGAESAGRANRTFRIDKLVWTLVSDDSVTAITRLRGLIASKIVDASFDNAGLAVAAGFADEVEEIKARHTAGDKAGAAQAVSERMWRAYGLAGTHDEVRAQATAYAGKVDTLVCMGSMFGLPDMQAYMREHFRAIDAVAPILS